jgi:proliferating cell nuclear antigen PCNA
MVCILELKTTQSVHIKTLVDALSPLLTDISIHFYPKTFKNEQNKEVMGGIMIKEINKTSTIIIHCKLDADKFDTYTYNYKAEKLSIGINLNNFLKCIKCMTNCDTMTWRIDSDDINKLIMILESANEKKTFKINLMDLENMDLDIEPEEFTYRVKMPTQDFQNYCKNMLNAATDGKMEIKCVDNTLFMGGSGDLGLIEFEVTATNNGSGLHIKKVSGNNNEIVQGKFELKFLITFTKCSNMCTHVTLYLKNRYPLIIEYNVSTLGVIKFALSPCKRTNGYDKADDNN